MLIDILNEDGSKTGQVTDIDDIHVRGFWHKSAHLWIVNCQNQILLQKRSKKMINLPDVWHISASGHVDAGEESLESVVREAGEEIGIKVGRDELILLSSFKDHSNDSCAGKFNNEFVDVYMLIKDIDIEKLTLDPDEVSEVQFMDLSLFKDLVLAREKTFAPVWSKFEFIIDYLENNRFIVEKFCRQ